MAKDPITDEELAQAFESHRPRLLAILMRRMQPVLLSRLDYEDVLQDCFVAARKRRAYRPSRIHPWTSPPAMSTSAWIFGRNCLRLP